MHIGLSHAICHVHVQRRIRRSRWIASCLPRAEVALREHEAVVDAIDRVEGIEKYRSAMDALVACVMPEMRPAIEAFYAGRGQPLLARGADAVALCDERLAAFVTAIALLDEAAMVAAIVVARSGIGDS